MSKTHDQGQEVSQEIALQIWIEKQNRWSSYAYVDIDLDHPEVAMERITELSGKCKTIFPGREQRITKFTITTDWASEPVP